MLKEHYRCHPKIINFCNKKFYNNELVIMTEDKDEQDVIKSNKKLIKEIIKEIIQVKDN